VCVGGARFFTEKVWRSLESQEILFILWNSRFIALLHDPAKYLLFSMYVIHLLLWQRCWNLPVYPSNTQAVKSVSLHILGYRKDSNGVQSFFLPHDIFRIMISWSVRVIVSGKPVNRQTTKHNKAMHAWICLDILLCCPTCSI
jgi:hypothetical protein